MINRAQTYILSAEQRSLHPTDPGRVDWPPKLAVID